MSSNKNRTPKVTGITDVSFEVPLFSLINFNKTIDLDSQKKEIMSYPRCGFGA